MTNKVIWITGLSGSGKTTLASELNQRLRNIKLQPILLDGDILRKTFRAGITDPQFYDRNARVEIGLKYALLCKYLSLQGFTVIIATISMFEEVYSWNKINLQNYFQVYLKVPLDELQLRDPKKIYEMYKKGLLSNVAGLDLVVDEPVESDVIFDFEKNPSLWNSPKNITDILMCELKKKHFL